MRKEILVAEIDMDPRADVQRMLRSNFTRSMLAFIVFRIALQGVGIFAILLWLATKAGLPPQTQKLLWLVTPVLLAIMCGLEAFLKYRNATYRMNMMEAELRERYGDGDDADHADELPL